MYVCDTCVRVCVYVCIGVCNVYVCAFLVSINVVDTRYACACARICACIVCMYVMYVYARVCHVCRRVRGAWVRACVHMCMHFDACPCMRMRVHMYACMRACMYVCVVYVCRYVCVRACMRARVCLCVVGHHAV